MNTVNYDSIVNGRPVTTIFTPTKIELLGINNGTICTMHDAAGTVHIFTAAEGITLAEGRLERLRNGAKLTNSGFTFRDRIREGIFYRRVKDLSDEFIKGMDECIEQERT